MGNKKSDLAVIALLVVLFGLVVPLGGWLLLKAMYHEKVTDYQQRELNKLRKEVRELLEELKERKHVVRSKETAHEE